MSDQNVPQNAPTTNLPFEVALRALKNGCKLSRAGWSRSGMFVYYVPEGEYPSVTQIAKETFGETVPYSAYLAFKKSDGSVVPWNPSQTCLLAQDWQIID